MNPDSYCPPERGGCWFCNTDKDEPDWLYSCEFDTNLHYNCLVTADPTNPEVSIMKEEFGMTDYNQDTIEKFSLIRAIKQDLPI